MEERKSPVMRKVKLFDNTALPLVLPSYKTFNPLKGEVEDVVGADKIDIKFHVVTETVTVLKEFARHHPHLKVAPIITAGPYRFDYFSFSIFPNFFNLTSLIFCSKKLKSNKI